MQFLSPHFEWLWRLHKRELHTDCKCHIWIPKKNHFLRRRQKGERKLKSTNRRREISLRKWHAYFWCIFEMRYVEQNDFQLRAEQNLKETWYWNTSLKCVWPCDFAQNKWAPETSDEVCQKSKEMRGKNSFASAPEIVRTRTRQRAVRCARKLPYATFLPHEHRKLILFSTKLFVWNRLGVCVCVPRAFFFRRFCSPVRCFGFHYHFVDLSCERVAKSCHCAFPYTILAHNQRHLWIQEQKLIAKEFSRCKIGAHTTYGALDTSFCISSFQVIPKVFKLLCFQTVAATGNGLCINFVVNKN